ncbi:MAG: hypothetical protein RL059_313 [Bacteroidota bacterium]|jgi:hypothetical protein
MITGNKGEWSEIYALFKLLGDQKLIAGDADLNKVENLFYPIIKIIRTETGGNYQYKLTGDLVLISGNNEEFRISIHTFSEQAAKLLNVIKGSTGSFRIPETEAFMKSVCCGTLKAKSTSKTDIRIVVHDQQINQTVELGFSIKSQLGGDSTLLNAGKTTNFIYQINRFKPSQEEINTINGIDTPNKIKDRIDAISKNGGIFSYTNLENSVFKNNLVLIDSLMPVLLSELIKTFYMTKFSSIIDLTESITNSNPLNYDNQFSHTFYEYKIKRLLTDIALGMTPSKVWSGIYDATGGYLIVKENGEVLCYHIYNRNHFEDYLFNNTKLDTASSARHEFGNLYEKNGQFYFKLNLQIRFK